MDARLRGSFQLAEDVKVFVALLSAGPLSGYGNDSRQTGPFKL